ncbi:MAG: hypothetical protein MJ072_05970, partial [Clostridia bacterium]|nr:hypothetical protein [Clostridia bacterium]
MKIIKKSKKFLYNFLAALLLVTFAFSSGAGVLSQAKGSTLSALFAGASGTTTVKIESESHTSSARAGKDGVINYRISATGVKGDVIVYYRTVNGSAVEKENFDAIPTVYGGVDDSGKIDLNGRCTLNEGQTYKDLSIQTRSGKYSTTSGSTTNEPCFYIEIYAVQHASVENGKGSLTCYVPTEHNINYENNDYAGGGYVFSEYKKADVSEMKTSPVFDNTIKDGHYPDWYMICYLTDSSRQKIWENDFIATDIASGFFSTDFYCYE